MHHAVSVPLTYCFTSVRTILLDKQEKEWVTYALLVRGSYPNTQIWKLIILRGRVLRDTLSFRVVASSEAWENGGGHENPLQSVILDIVPGRAAPKPGILIYLQGLYYNSPPLPVEIRSNTPSWITIMLFWFLHCCSLFILWMYHYVTLLLM